MTKKKSYTVEFKMKVITYYNAMETPNITHAAKYFGLERNNIKKWIWSKEFIIAQVNEARKDKHIDQFKKLRKISHGRKPILTSPNEKMICKELTDLRSDGTKVDNNVLKKKA